jgi:predicted RNA binding protein YcfA (HicA-like mRNA interferase family)
MPKLPAMTAREVERILERAGFVFVRQTDHRIWRKGGHTVPVPTHRGDLKTGTLRGIIELSGMTAQEFLSYRD